MDTGLIHIYCGDGKGRTTAALGLAIRCAGHGGRVLFAQFLKERKTGELVSLSRIPTIAVLRGKGCEKFTFQMTPDELAAAKAMQGRLFQEIQDRVRRDAPDLLVLDEILGTCSLGLLDEKEVLRFLQNKPKKLEVVMTGRNPSQALLDQADYISEICKRKHPFDKGIAARVGIEE